MCLQPTYALYSLYGYTHVTPMVFQFKAPLVVETSTKYGVLYRVRSFVKLLWPLVNFSSQLHLKL
jgi:hypothetical protein